MRFEDKAAGILIEAKSIDIHPSVAFGKNIDIRLNGSFRVGPRSFFGSNVTMRGNNVSIGSDFFHTSGLTVGGGGNDYPTADLSIGDRCVLHNNFINVCEPVIIGDDVGLSADVAIITHGFWWSVFEGHPARFQGVTIGNRTIVGYRAIILMGARIGEEVVIGAASVVSRDLESRAVYAGNPIQKIRDIRPLAEEGKRKWFSTLEEHYRRILGFHNLSPSISFDFPAVTVNGCRFDLDRMEMSGPEDEYTDHFRDFARKYGFRFYTGRPFRSVKK